MVTKRIPFPPGHRRWGARLLALALCLTGLPVAATAVEGGALLSTEDLQTLEPAYDLFLQDLADMIIARGLLDEADREDWVRYQLGDYYQNGGFGTISAMFTPDLLNLARPEEMLLRLQKELPVGTLHLDTMSAYSPLDATLPGLLLEASLLDAQGLPVACRFRWHSTHGGFVVWEGGDGQVQEIGNTYINDGRPSYWSDQPIAGDPGNAVWTIQLEILDAFDDTKILGTADLLLTPQGNGWTLDTNALQ